MNSDTKQLPNQFVSVPWRSVSTDALLGLLEEYITREGTDYGQTVLTLEEKVARAKVDLENESVLIVVDLVSESTHILSAEDFKKALDIDPDG